MLHTQAITDSLLTPTQIRSFEAAEIAERKVLVIFFQQAIPLHDSRYEYRVAFAFLIL
jgi:hypothetical protein